MCEHGRERRYQGARQGLESANRTLEKATKTYPNVSAAGLKSASTVVRSKCKECRTLNPRARFSTARRYDDLVSRSAWSPDYMTNPNHPATPEGSCPTSVRRGAPAPPRTLPAAHLHQQRLDRHLDAVRSQTGQRERTRACRRRSIRIVGIAGWPSRPCTLSTKGMLTDCARVESTRTRRWSKYPRARNHPCSERPRFPRMTTRLEHRVRTRIRRIRRGDESRE